MKVPNPNRIVSALKRDCSTLRQALEDVLDLALTEELSRGGPLGYRLVELVGAVLRKKRPAPLTDERSARLARRLGNAK
jgi:hypothetical protein